MVGENAAQAGGEQEKAHQMTTEERLHVQTVCRNSSSIAPALLLGHRLDGSGACGSTNRRRVR